jgi:molecular chaperone GrpE (heat shock protein)
MNLIHLNTAKTMFDEINQLKDKISENLSEILTLKNAIKNLELEKQDIRKEFFLGIIDVIDSYENKESSLFSKYTADNEHNKIINSFSIIKKRLFNLLEKYGVTKITFPENKLIIGFSKVVGTEPDLTRKNDSIISIVRNGYIKGHEVIREAELIVVKN